MNRNVLCSLVFCFTLAGCGGGGSDDDSPGTGEPGAPPQFGASRCGDHPWCDARLSPAARTELLLAAMTLEQKLGSMGGDDVGGVITGNPSTGSVNGIPELDIPPIH